MRISDWSSDVCSSDLGRGDFQGGVPHHRHADRRGLFGRRRAAAGQFPRIAVAGHGLLGGGLRLYPPARPDAATLYVLAGGLQRLHYRLDTKSVVSGKRVAVRVVIGGSRDININIITLYTNIFKDNKIEY